MPWRHVDILLLFESLATWSTLRENVPRWPAINVGTFINVHCQFLQQLPLKPSSLPWPLEPRSKVLLLCIRDGGAGAQTVAEWKSASQPVRHQTAGWLFRIHFLLLTHFLEPQLDVLATIRYRISAFFFFFKEYLNCWILQTHSWM